MNDKKTKTIIGRIVYKNLLIIETLLSTLIMMGLVHKMSRHLVWK